MPKFKSKILFLLLPLSFSFLAGVFLSSTVLKYNEPSSASFISCASLLNFENKDLTTSELQTKIAPIYQKEFSVLRCEDYFKSGEESVFIEFQESDDALNVMNLFIKRCVKSWQFSRNNDCLVVTNSSDFASATKYDYYVGVGMGNFPV